ncbi:hypothetical protein [Salmonella phage vB_SpuS_NX263]|nr:hypothetical protein [Salmonella phage vB_SpuS_NX263]
MKMHGAMLASVITMVYNKRITTLLHSYHHPTFNPPCAGSFFPL